MPTQERDSQRTSRMGDLPAQPTPLIGRERELVQLTQLLTAAETRLLTLTGPAGTGKTRLAVQLATAVGDRFASGCAFVDLAPIRDPSLVISAIATSVGARDVGHRPLTEAVTHHLQDREVLLLLDNFEQVLAAGSALAHLLGATRQLKILVTSRAALHLWRWEREFAVTPLALPDLRGGSRLPMLETVPSVQLFVERCRARQPDFALRTENAAAVAEICVRLDGLPLGIELAAAAIKHLSPEEILTRLQARTGLLAAGGDDFPTRHQSLQQAVGWSFDLLPPAEQRVLRRLAVFAGGFSIVSAEAVCAGDGIDGNDVLPLLARLADQSLVVVESRGARTRYRLLETIREFAADCLRAADEDHRFRRRHAEWCVEMGLRAEAELPGARQSEWLDRLEADHDNLRAALDWLAASGDAETGLRLATALWPLWWLRGYLSEGRRRLETLLARVEGTRTSTWVRAALAAGTLAFRQGDYAAARDHLEGSLTQARRLDDAASIASALRTLGRMAVDRGEFDSAETLLSESLDLERELGSAAGTAWSLNYLGLLAHFAGDNPRARTLLEQSLPMHRALDDRWGTAVGLAYSGRVAFELGDPLAAESMWTESLATCRAQGYLWCVPYLFDSFGGLAIANGDFVRGARLAGAADALHETVGAPLPLVWQVDLDRQLDPARRALGTVAFGVAWNDGRRMTLDQAADEIRPADVPTPHARQRVAAVSSGPPLETRYARSGEVSIAYQVLGDGPIDLVFVMGWVSHLDYYWEEPGFARFLRRLASFARLIVFDKRGTGLSDRGVGLPTLEQRMDDVRAVLDAAGSQRAALVGISEAGALCALFAATYPERTSALTLVGCFPRRLWAADYPHGDPPEAREARLHDIERSWASLDWARRDLERRAPSAAHDEAFIRWWATYLRMSASPGAALDLLRMNNQIDIRPVLPNIHVPTLVVHRSGDRTVPVEAGRYLAAHIQAARFFEAPGQDHLPFVGDQDLLLDAIEGFLTGTHPLPEPDRVLATVLVLEITNAAATLARVGQQAWREIERAYLDLFREQLARSRGRLASPTGTWLIATFDGPARGIRCALAVLEAGRELGLEQRAAVHTGECDVVDGELAGLPFRVATAATAAAESGEVLVSSTVRDLVAGSGIPFDARDRPIALEGSGAWSFVGVARAGAHPQAKVSDPLTPREREVAVLLASGLTNRQIGDQLVISPATAERHVVNIFNKLGLHSRSQLAAWVVEQRLGHSG